MADVLAVDMDDTWRKRRRGMLIRATLIQNVGMGCAFGGLGVSVLALQDRYDASLGLAAGGLSLAVMAMMGMGPLVANLLPRWGVRRVMLCGVLTALTGYVALAFAPSIIFALAACALLIGPGTSFLASLPPAVLMGRWYPEARGRVMGITYLPILVTLTPVIGVYIIKLGGLTTFYLSLALLHFLLLPIVATVHEAPREALAEHPTADHGTASVSARSLLGHGLFWLILLGDCILNGTNIVGSAHIVPVATDYGHTMEMGALLLSITGGASIIGSLLAGYTCDRIGPARTLSCAALGFASAWATIAITGWLPSFAVAAFMIGLCGASVFPPVSALVVQIFGIDALPKALSLLGLMGLPFTFFMSPAAGWLRETTGDYRAVFAILITACLISATGFFCLSRLTRTKEARSLSFQAPVMATETGVGSIAVAAQKG